MDGSYCFGSFVSVIVRCHLPSSACVNKAKIYTMELMCGRGQLYIALSAFINYVSRIIIFPPCIQQLYSELKAGGLSYG